MRQLHLQSEDHLLPGDSTTAAARSNPAAAAAPPLFRLDLVRSLQMHRGLALGITLAGVALAAAYWFATGPVYVAQSVVYIQPAPPRVMEQGPNVPYPQRWPYDSTTYESYIQQQMQNVLRPDVLSGAVRKLGQQSSESEEATAERIRHSIEVKREGTGYQFSIIARASDGSAAAALANAVAASYIESASHEQKSGDAQRLAVLGEERDRVQHALTADRTEQEALNKQLGVAAIGPAAPDVYDEDIGRIRGELITARTAHDQAAAKLTTIDAGKGASSAALDAEADELVSTDAGLVSMKQSLNQRRAILISHMANLTPTNPAYKQDAAELAQINANLDSMMKDLRAKASARILERERTDLERTAQVEARLNGQLGQLAAAAGSATSKLQRSNDLAVDIARLQNRYTAVDEEWRNLTLEEGAPGSAFLSAAASAPMHPVITGVARNAALLALAGLFFGMIAAVTAHKLDPRVYTAADVERVLGYSPMAQLPNFDQVSEGVADEHLLRLAAAIEYVCKRGNLKSCIFTGIGPGTGVTTVATRVRNLLQAMGRTTVLLDTRTPSPAPLPNGEPNTNALATTGRGSRPEALLQQMAQETRTHESLVLTDAAPLVVSAETQYLARFVDCAIVFIQSGVTTRAELHQAASTLQQLDVAAVGFVLNRVGREKAGRSFRQSVEAIEKHLQSQGSSTVRRTQKTRALAAETTPAQAPAIKEAPTLKEAPALKEAQALKEAPAFKEAPAIEEAPTTKEVAAMPRNRTAVLESAQAEALRLSPELAEWFGISSPLPLARPSTSPVHDPLPDPVRESIQATPTPDPDLPWWLADKLPRPVEARRRAPSPPAKDPAPLPAGAAAQTVAATPKPRPEPQLWPSQIPSQAKSWEPVPSEYQKPTLAVPAAKTQPDGWKTRVPAIIPPVAPAVGTTQNEIKEHKPDDASSGLAFRLSGISRLLSVLNSKSHHETQESQTEEPANPTPEPSQPFIPQLSLSQPFPGRSIIQPSPSRQLVPALAAAIPSVTAPKLVTADPEFLPPRNEAAEKKSRIRHERQESSDDVETLPSWRGQYRNR